MLQTFLPLFIMTFGICLFIVLMQFLWRYIDDMVGKGLGIPVLGEMFFYAGLSYGWFPNLTLKNLFYRKETVYNLYYKYAYKDRYNRIKEEVHKL